MIKGILIDFGGTIDSDGIHWFNAFREGYSVVQDMPEDVLRESYVYAERTLGRNQIITPDYSFCKTLQTKIVLQTQFLNSKGILFTKQDTVLDYCYNKVVKHISTVSKPVLERLRSRYPIVLVTNFYGNMHTVLREFGLDHLFKAVIESSVVGVRKPDPEIFRLGVVANIDLTNKFWVPIGTEENPFGGVFNLGHFRIYGTYHAEEYEVLSWNAYCYGVFGYITEDAKIITSTTAIQAAIIIGSVILGIAIIAGTVIFIIARKKKKKLQKHANNVSVDDVASEDEYVDEESGEVYDDEPQDDGEYEDDSYDGEGEEEWQDEGEYEESDEPVEDDEMTNEDYMEQIDEKAKELDNVETPEAPKAFDVAEFVKNLSNENKLQPKQDNATPKSTSPGVPKPPKPPKKP